MPSFEEQLKKYAELIVRSGVNLQPGQALAVRSELIHRDLVHALVRAGYQAGARYVGVDWLDQEVVRLRALHSDPQALDYVPHYLTDRAIDRMRTDWAYISVSGRGNPDVFEDVDPEHLQRLETAGRDALKDWYAHVMSDQMPWCICAGVTPAWALQVFPGEDTEAAVEKLWNAVFAAVRLDKSDPAAAWKEHQINLNRIVNFLHRNKVCTLHFFDETPGPDGRPHTDLHIGLTDRPRWVAGGATTPSGIEFMPNMPTEEAFTTPHRERTEGYMRTTMPFLALERRVEGAYFRFEKGEVVEFSAEKGEDALRRFFNIDGARRLGEIALVDVDSPIYQSGILFYNTLFDENAACHIAFGRAYPTGVQGYQELTDRELEAMGVNDSPMHQDVMIGSDRLTLTGYCDDGTQIVMMRQGRYTKEVLQTSEAS